MAGLSLGGGCAWTTLPFPRGPCSCPQAPSQLRREATTGLEEQCAAHLADVTGPRCLLLPGGGHQDDCEGRGILRLHPNLKIQAVGVLARPFGFQLQNTELAE